MQNYSQVREELGLDIEKKYNEKHAYITHYFHNPSEYKTNIYFEKLKEILNSIDVNVVRESYSLPFNWDVPFPPPVKPKFTFIDLFAGIGGFRLALQKFEGKCVFSSEIDNAAKKTYEMNFGEVPFGDIRFFTNNNVTDEVLNKLIPDHDILAAGFPCQPFSRAGVSARNFLNLSHGFEDEDQGNLFFDILRIAEIKRPKVLFLENVKNLKSHDKGRTFNVIEKMIRKLGYSFNSQIINSQTLVPQRRERTYMVCFQDSNIQYNFPEFRGEAKSLESILQENVEEKYTISDRLWKGHQNRTRRNLARGTGFTAKTADLKKPSNTLVARYYKDGKECLIPQEGKNPRKLTPRECARLQGYPESFLHHSSNSSAYKQFGNSVSVPVIERIAGTIVDKII